MKKNDIFILIATAAYSYLFYNQSPGINFALLSALIVFLLYIKDRSLLKQPTWLAAALGTLLSSYFVFWWGTALPVLANICSLAILAGFSFDSQSSLLFAAGNTLVSVLVSIPRLFHSAAKQHPAEEAKPSILKKIMLLSIPVCIALVFVVIYSYANPIFAKFVDQINFDWISFDWIIFTTIGFFIMFGIFNIYMLRVNDRDRNASDSLQPITGEEHVLTGSGKWLSADNELLTGAVLFALLNLVLLTVNSLDVYYMWVINRLPDGVTIASFLHDSTDTLIFSILLAIAVLLFVFRGYLNFIENNRWLKTLAYGWIAQNILLVITTANTNWWIIQSTGLTRRRIGVYVYLGLCIIGLITTFIKVALQKSNWFLFRKNAWAFYAVFITACFFNWDEIIVDYNCKNYKALELEYIDRGYQAELSHTCLASLFNYYHQEKSEGKDVHQVFTKPVVNAMYQNYRKLELEIKAEGWQSYCYSKHSNLQRAQRIIDTSDVPEE
jgi:Domain of unknown function (DUF4173)